MPIKIIRQDITKIECDVIVAPTDEGYSHGGGADRAIHEAAGDELYAACLEAGELSVGGAVLTPAFKLPQKYVIHTVGPVYKDGNSGEEEMLRSCYRTSLRLARDKGCESIAFPLISSGRFGFPKDRVLKIAMDEIAEFLFECEMLVYIAVFDKSSYSISEKLFSDITSFIKDTERVCYSFSAMPPSASERPASRYDASRKPRKPKKVLDELDEYCFSEAPSEISLEDMLRDMDRGFAETLFSYIDKKGLTDVECYKRANVDKKTFSKIKCNKDYKPSKLTAVSFAIALRLDLSETEHLLKTVGMSLSRSSKFDIIIEYFVTTGNYKDIFDVNETLYQFDQMTLGV